MEELSNQTKNLEFRKKTIAGNHKSEEISTALISNLEDGVNKCFSLQNAIERKEIADKTIEFMKLFPKEKDKHVFQEYGVHGLMPHILDSNKNALMCRYMKYFLSYDILNYSNLENFYEMCIEFDQYLIDNDIEKFDFKQYLENVYDMTLKRMNRDKNILYNRGENIERKGSRSLVLYARFGWGEMEGIHFTAMSYRLHRYIYEQRSSIFDKFIITSYHKDLYPKYIHNNLGIHEQQYVYRKGSEFIKLLTNNTTPIVLTHSNVEELQKKGTIPIIAQGVLQNNDKFFQDKHYIPLQLFFDRSDKGSPQRYNDFKQKDRSISLDRTLKALLFSVSKIENHYINDLNHKLLNFVRKRFNSIPSFLSHFFSPNTPLE